MCTVIYESDEHDNVMVMAASMESEVLDASGQQRLTQYRMVLPMDNDVVMAFFVGEKPSESGQYENPQFVGQTLVIEGMLAGTDSNPEDLSNPIKVLKPGAKLVFLADAFAELDEADNPRMASTEGMERYKTKVAYQSQIQPGYSHPEGAEVVKIDTISEEIWLVEVQAHGWQEVFEMKQSDLEPVVEIASES
jgi:hypothetical protein